MIFSGRDLDRLHHGRSRAMAKAPHEIRQNVLEFTSIGVRQGRVISIKRSKRFFQLCRRKDELMAKLLFAI